MKMQMQLGVFKKDDRQDIAEVAPCTDDKSKIPERILKVSLPNSIIGGGA